MTKALALIHVDPERGGGRQSVIAAVIIAGVATLLFASLITATAAQG